jgi:hypothetical protein
MRWIMMSERSDELELSIDGTPPVIERHGWRFDEGRAVTITPPVIDVPFQLERDETIPDNIPAYGTRGLLINDRVKAVLDGLAIDNVQYFAARLIDQRSRTVWAPYWIANVVGRVACIDHDRSDLETYEDGAVKFIDSLSLIALPDHAYGHIFRLAEFPPAMVISDTLKRALEAAGITGLRTYRPEQFSL